jgi:hypothetical protein
MKADDPLAPIRALLAAERDAVVAADSARVLELSAEKEVVMAELLARGVHRQVDPAAWRELVEDLRRGLLLLVHARACAKDVVDTLGGRASCYTRDAQAGALSTGIRLSLRG